MRFRPWLRIDATHSLIRSSCCSIATPCEGRRGAESSLAAPTTYYYAGTVLRRVLATPSPSRDMGAQPGGVFDAVM